jgi:hypothetical protein
MLYGSMDVINSMLFDEIKSIHHFIDCSSIILYSCSKFFNRNTIRNDSIPKSESDEYFYGKTKFILNN